MRINSNNPFLLDYEYKSKKQNTEEKLVKTADEINTSKNEFNILSGKKIEYILQGGMIKIYVSDGKSEPKCVKCIPVKDASKELLAKVQCQSISDALYINDLMESKDDSNKK